ncbi:MAG: hypothetical protein N3B13_00005, partial [Deltaproteobacteria bacterium]|nr:hypothetical protein [Deltaproteobacteria bacterium]
MKKSVLFIVTVIFLGYACTGEDKVTPVCDVSNCISDTISQDIITRDSGQSDTGTNDAEEKTLCSLSEEVTLTAPEIVSGAEIDYEFGKVTITGNESGPAEKTQFDVILKNGGITKIKTDNNGEFTVVITQEELKKLPETFEIVLTITPPANFGKEVKNSRNVISFYRYENTKFSFVLSYSNGYFIVTPKEQLYKLTTKMAGGKKALDAFINATTKAVVPDKAEPVPGAEIIIDRPLGVPPKKDKKKSMFFTEGGKTEDIIVQCYEFVAGEELVTTTNNEGYFSFRISGDKGGYILFTISPGDNNLYKYDAASFLVDLPVAEEGIYDMMLTFEKADSEKGKFIIIGPIPYQPCSEFNNPVCKPTKCKMVGGQVGKCQYLYDSSSGTYKCGCFNEVCNADCTGNCKMPDGNQGICHIEEITSTYEGAEVVNKSCVCGPLDLECKMKCQTNQDCILQTANQLPMCATDMFGNSFCTKGCTNASDCPSPFSICAKMGPDNRGICICPCVNADNAQAQCSPIGMY